MTQILESKSLRQTFIKLEEANKNIAIKYPKNNKFFYENLSPDELDRLRKDMKELATITLLILEDEE